MTQPSIWIGPTPDDVEWDKDSWCTQPEVTEAVHRYWPGGIHLDCCSNYWANKLGFVRAEVTWRKQDDCMSFVDWNVRGPTTTCFGQPPYSEEGAPIVDYFCRKIWDEGQLGEALWLVKLDPSTRRYRQLADRSSSIVLFNFRLEHFESGIRKKGSDFNSVMFSLTRRDHEDRHEALKDAVGDLGWVHRF